MEESIKEMPDGLCSICIEHVKPNSECILRNCNHKFHMYCILKWLKIKNICPLCNIIVTSVQYKKRIVEVEDKLDKDITELSDFLQGIYCQICETGLDEEVLLLCDNCNLGYHTYCLDPQLDVVPYEDWYCHACDPLSQLEEDRIDMSEDSSDLFKECEDSSFIELVHCDKSDGEARNEKYRSIRELHFEQPKIKRTKIDNEDTDFIPESF